MKKVLIIIVLCLLVGYLIFSIFYFREKPKEGVCSKFEVELQNASKNDVFVYIEDIEKSVKEAGLDPTGKQFKDINTSTIEEAIQTNQFVKKAHVFVTNNGAIKALIEEREPILRVMNNDGKSYYIDNEGQMMPLSKRFTAYLPIATGAIKEDFATGDLYKFALFLHNNIFWNAQIEQIIVQSDRDIRLIPRVGEHQIVLGDLNDYKQRLDKLMTFYEKGLNEVGWNKYSVINLSFDKQVVCTKR
ncbi:MAG: cell division protein FtsQ/DivIB [Prevotella sp.]|jgi:cell division protein FtsQ|nr:cell division protein FtsQ/DivIB [Prevotella sp.]